MKNNMTSEKNDSTNQKPTSSSKTATTCPSANASTAAARENAVKEAWGAHNAFIPGALSAMVGEQRLSVLGAKLYLEAVLAEAGRPADPVERILLEQMVMAHHRLSLLNTMTLSAKSPQMVTAINTAATRLLGEIRRLALAIRQYRLPPGQRSFSIVHQQNVVAKGEQTVQYVDAGQGQATMTAHDTLNSKPQEAIGGRISGDNTDADAEESATGGGRPVERRQTSAVE